MTATAGRNGHGISPNCQLEYDADHRWLIHTERLGPNEYGAAEIVARDLSPEWAEHVRQWIAATHESRAIREALGRLADLDYFSKVGDWDGWRVATRMRDFAQDVLATLPDPAR